MANELPKSCLSSGVRITYQRQIMVGIMENSEDHPNVVRNYPRAVEEDTKISITIVYRTVKLPE